MAKKKTRNVEEKLTYQKVPFLGNNGKMMIFCLLVIIGITVYMTYFKPTKVLVCKQNSSIELNTKIPSDVVIKVNFKNEIYNGGTIKEVLDLSSYDDEKINNFISSNAFCKSILLPGNINDLYSFSKCKQEVDGKKLTITADFNRKSDSDKIKINDEKSTLEKAGYKCAVE